MALITSYNDYIYLIFFNKVKVSLEFLRAAKVVHEAI